MTAPTKSKWIVELHDGSFDTVAAWVCSIDSGAVVFYGPQRNGVAKIVLAYAPGRWRSVAHRRCLAIHCSQQRY